MDRPEGSRYDYLRGALLETDVEREPLDQLRRWLEEATLAEVVEPTAIVLATVDATGTPDARVVLMRGVDDRGIRWFTNRRSAKGIQIAAHPVAAAVVHWQKLERQVRLRGPVELLADAESDEYFASRPRDAQLGAWASDQSEPIDGREALEQQVAAVAERFDGEDVPRPDHWGGYLLRPDTVEFWQGRASRLHDRLVYTRSTDGWDLERRQP